MYAAVTSLNAVDLLMAVVIAIIVFAGWRGKIVSELIKLFGILCTVFIALHYYARLADFLRVQFFGKDAPTEFFAFCLLAVLFSAAFILISHGWVLILKMKPHPRIDRYGGLAFSVVRSYFTCGLIFFALILAGHPSATPLAKNSMSCVIFRHAAENLYRASSTGFIAKYFPNEKVNEGALALTAKRPNEKDEE